MKRLLIAAALFATACAPAHVTTTPQPPPAPTQVTFDWVACAVQPANDACPQPIAYPTFKVHTCSAAAPNSPCPNGDTYDIKTGDGAGYAIFTEPMALAYSDVTVLVDGYEPYATSFQPAQCTDGCHNIATLVSEHFNPWSLSDADVENFRGSLFTAREGDGSDCDAPGVFPSQFRPRAGQPSNILYPGALFYSAAQRDCSYKRWSEHYHYTHFVVGPFIDPGYHGLIPSVDFRENPQAVLGVLTEMWDQNLKGRRTIPIIAVVPDHWGSDKGFTDHVWNVDDLRALEPIYRSPEFQRLARVVMLCWECQGSQYGWSNRQYVEYGKWLADVFPNAIRVLHTISDIEAPVGNGDETNIANCGSKTRNVDCLTNGEAWANVTRYFHAWFFQSNAMFYPGTKASDGTLDANNWYALWDVHARASFADRFRNGYAGWPVTSANKPDVNGGHFCATAGEYRSMVSYWEDADEQLTLDIGAHVLELGGSCGFMDGGRIDAAGNPQKR